MCGITGILLHKDTHIGSLLTLMMNTLQHRGTDSAGVAIYAPPLHTTDEYVIRIFTRDVIGAASKISTAIAHAGGDIRSIHLNPVNGYGFDKYTIKTQKTNLKQIASNIISTKIAKVISIGRSLEIIKDVCTVDALEKRFTVSNITGTHGIGHVRFSTESQVDLLHAHPFQTFDYPDMAIVHNGQITNYITIRDRLERKGLQFETENDSELIVHYIADKLNRGQDLKAAMSDSVKDLDGPFAYIISTDEAIGIARDKLGLRPAIILECKKLFAIASEESALRSISQSGSTRNVQPGEVITRQQ